MTFGFNRSSFITDYAIFATQIHIDYADYAVLPAQYKSKLNTDYADCAFLQRLILKSIHY